MDPLRSHSNHRPSPFVRSFLHALDRMQERETLRPHQLVDHARSVLAQRLEPSDAPVEAAFAHGFLSLNAVHTHFFDGFALVQPLAQGVAVALRRAPTGRVLLEDAPGVWALPTGGPVPADTPASVALVYDVVRRFGPADAAVEVAVVGTLPASGTDVFLGALAVATARALLALEGVDEPPEDFYETLRDALAASLGRPFSMAYPIAADVGRPGAFLLVDGRTLEHLPVEAPSAEQLGWGVVLVPESAAPDAPFYRRVREQAEAARATLNANGFPQLASLRDLEHRDLQRALDVLPRRHRPVVRYLVAENRRVQKLVRAIRRTDWQLFGALLLMSHAALRNDLAVTSTLTDVAVAEVEAMSLDGIYGACVVGDGCMAVAGRPFMVPTCLDRIQDLLAERVGHRPDVLLL